MILVNGEKKNIAAKLTVSALLEQENFQQERLAVLLNETVLPRVKYAQTLLNDGDKLEIVQFVAGG